MPNTPRAQPDDRPAGAVALVVIATLALTATCSTGINPSGGGGGAAVGEGDAAMEGTPLFRVPVNEADVPTLALLPDIGPGRAAAMIQTRRGAPFADTADLQRVNGIGPVIAERVTPYVRFDYPQSNRRERRGTEAQR